ncbi:hypothetical protein Salat_0614200 [Sesamum alatum]|uniref:Uncharacterized protein n=1 Tax=Sesamum alatum TaxID=300844 RepID=A0AAE1YQT4_9LAMI|nr:hypothetical protein Salat_0614200 [Sesamum alatum]
MSSSMDFGLKLSLTEEEDEGLVVDNLQGSGQSSGKTNNLTLISRLILHRSTNFEALRNIVCPKRYEDDFQDPRESVPFGPWLRASNQSRFGATIPGSQQRNPSPSVWPQFNSGRGSSGRNDSSGGVRGASIFGDFHRYIIGRSVANLQDKNHAQSSDTDLESDTLAGRKIDTILEKELMADLVHGPALPTINNPIPLQDPRDSYLPRDPPSINPTHFLAHVDEPLPNPNIMPTSALCPNNIDPLPVPMHNMPIPNIPPCTDGPTPPLTQPMSNSACMQPPLLLALTEPEPPLLPSPPLTEGLVECISNAYTPTTHRFSSKGDDRDETRNLTALDQYGLKPSGLNQNHAKQKFPSLGRMGHLLTPIAH